MPFLEPSLCQWRWWCTARKRALTHSSNSYPKTEVRQPVFTLSHLLVISPNFLYKDWFIHSFIHSCMHSFIHHLHVVCLHFSFWKVYENDPPHFPFYASASCKAIDFYHISTIHLSYPTSSFHAFCTVLYCRSNRTLRGYVRHCDGLLWHSW